MILYYNLAYKILLKNNTKKYIIFIPTLPHLKNIILKTTKNWKIKTILSTSDKVNEKLYQKVFVSVTCSGTASLELAKRNIPQLIIYKFNFFTSIIASLFVKVKYANLINIFANEMIIPELTNFNLTKSKFVFEFNKLISDTKSNEKQIYNINKNLDNFESKESPYLICTNRIKKII